MAIMHTIGQSLFIYFLFGHIPVLVAILAFQLPGLESYSMRVTTSYSYEGLVAAAIALFYVFIFLHPRQKNKSFPQPQPKPQPNPQSTSICAYTSVAAPSFSTSLKV